MNHTYALNTLNRGLPVPYWWSFTLQFYLRSPRMDTVFSTSSGSSVEGKKTRTNGIPLSSMVLINFRNAWIPLPSKKGPRILKNSDMDYKSIQKRKKI